MEPKIRLQEFVKFFYRISNSACYIFRLFSNRDTVKVETGVYGCRSCGSTRWPGSWISPMIHRHPWYCETVRTGFIFILLDSYHPTLKYLQRAGTLPNVHKQSFCSCLLLILYGPRNTSLLHCSNLDYWSPYSTLYSNSSRRFENCLGSTATTITTSTWCQTGSKYPPIPTFASPTFLDLFFSYSSLFLVLSFKTDV